MKNNLLNNVKNFIHYEIVKKKLFYHLTNKQFAQIDYLMYQHKLLNIKHPRSFSEKLQWMKVYGGLEEYSNYVDKYEVRKVIEEKIGKEYLVHLYGAWDKFEEIDFTKLPNKFVLKGSHGSGYIYICKDKSKLDLYEVKRITDKWINEDFYLRTRETQYKPCKPKIICEAYLEDSKGELIDYKIFCFGGKAKFVEVMWDRFTDHRGDIFMDLEWKKQDFTYIGATVSSREHERPNNFEKMIEIAETLSKPFSFVRVDLYSVNKKIYFGELTFIPTGGLEQFDHNSIENEWGNMVDITKYPGYNKRNEKEPYFVKKHTLNSSH